jgi:hypothetical protein
MTMVRPVHWTRDLVLLASEECCPGNHTPETTRPVRHPSSRPSDCSPLTFAAFDR